MTLDHAHQRLRLQILRRLEEIGADPPARVRQPPAVRMEHRHDGEDHVAFVQAGNRTGGERIGVKHRRAVAVDHAFWISGRATRIRHRRRRALVEHRPIDTRRLRGQEVLVSVKRRPRRSAQGRIVAAPNHDDVFDRLQLFGHLPEQGHERIVDDDGFVRSVVDHERQLLGKQPYV